MSKLGLLVVVALALTVAGAAGYMAYHGVLQENIHGNASMGYHVHGVQREGSWTPVSHEQSEHGYKSLGGRGDSTRMGTGNAYGTCSISGWKQSVGHNIKWLLDNHHVFTYKLDIYIENRTIVWIVNAPTKNDIEVLVEHVMQMMCALERGAVPREFDPLFKLEAALAKYVNTTIEWLNDTAVKIVKRAGNDCAFEVAKLHAEVVRGFFDTGRLEAQKLHEIPEHVRKLCAQYIVGEG